MEGSQRSTSICVLDPDGKTVVEGQAKTNPFEIGRYLQKRLEGPLKLGMDRILALPWAAQERRLVEKRLEAQGRLTCTVRRSAHLSRRSFVRSEEHTSELQSLMRISYAVFCLKKKKSNHITYNAFIFK